VDPVQVAVVVTCAQGVTRLVDALAYRIVTRARGELLKAAASSPGVEVAEEGRHGPAWRDPDRNLPGSSR
jgi:hypothetical protein